LSIRSSFFILICFAVASTLRAQKAEFGTLAGGSYYYGDIVNYGFQPKSVGPGMGVFLRYHLNPKMALRANLMYCRIQGADSNLASTPETKWQRTRNLAFYSDIIEVSGIIEYNLIQDVSNSKKIGNRLVPYVFGGIGLFYFEPMAIHPLTGKAIALRPLQLEGTRYLPVAIAVPLGAGMRLYVNGNWQIGIELGLRVTSTSHLDDITGASVYADPENLPNDDARIMAVRNANSLDAETQIASSFAGKPRGKIGYINDLYVIGGITLSYRLWPQGGSGIEGKAIRCPRFY
jgi:Domain of unknown function (DUF6089)